ncbi:MAG TPA: biopolymer transporter ExbD [Candidatus Acidoferrales bacterium]|jgi:biopolymer transport protein TolR|nr:biopolymer transporter ExbD [Candidatus Acidoferrales bacterium]
MAFTNKAGRTETSLSDINITPFVDVVLVLLIIFMVTAPVLQSGIEVNVPKTRTVKQISDERLVISITKGQEVYLNNDHVKLDELGGLLHEKIRDPRGQALYVRADKDVAFGAFATVMSTVQAAGITNISVVTEPLEVKK